jgi:hypothetical protein
MKQLEEIKGRLQAATPGPWKMDEGSYHVFRGEDMICADLYTEPDAEFIANAPTDIERLVAAVEEIASLVTLAETLCEMNGTEKRLASVPVVQIRYALSEALTQ